MTKSNSWENVRNVARVWIKFFNKWVTEIL